MGYGKREQIDKIPLLSSVYLGERKRIVCLTTGIKQGIGTRSDDAFNDIDGGSLLDGNLQG